MTAQPARIARPPAIVTDPAARTAQLTALNSDYPGWHAWAADDGRIYAGAARVFNAKNGTEAGSTLYADNPAEMREQIAALERQHPRLTLAVALTAAMLATRTPGRHRRRDDDAAEAAADDATVSLFERMNSPRRILRLACGIAVAPGRVSVRSALTLLAAVLAQGRRS